MKCCTKLQLRPEPLTSGLPPSDPRSLCPQLNLLNPASRKKNIPRYATASEFSVPPLSTAFLRIVLKYQKFRTFYYMK